MSEYDFEHWGGRDRLGTDRDPMEVRIGWPDRRPPAARIAAKVAGIWRVPAPYRRRVRLGFPDAEHVIKEEHLRQERDDY